MATQIERLDLCLARAAEARAAAEAATLANVRENHLRSEKAWAEMAARAAAVHRARAETEALHLALKTAF